MLISPPFLPPRAADQTEDQWLEAAMPGGEPGNGAYPVSYNLGWHGGLHLTAPPRGNSGVELVRAIADGTVVYRRGSAEPPAPPEENAPLNYRGDAVTEAEAEYNHVPHWRKIRTPTGTGWVNLNAQGVRKFSDADFPHWRGWRLVEDAQGGDSLCSDPAILRELDGDHDDTITAEEAHTRLDSPEVKALLKKLICKFPTEWEAATIEARWGWLKQASPTNPEPMTEEQFQALRAHIEALAFWQQANLQVPQYDAQGQPSGGQPLPNAHWRFDPHCFI
ncbi:hypothetical protein DL771_011327 [Monosporascus sp. 5C6A]|nr:hypothetical protein DL771_011327 [Monosporascus sp. 5C6A]